MIRPGYFLSLLFVSMLACATFSAPVVSSVTPTQGIANPSTLPNSALVDVYDPARDPAEDLKRAIPIAQKENKRIILELGGDWCIWCRHMDDFYAAHRDLLQFRVDHYVLVKVNVSEENMNAEFLSQFPEAAGYPHIYVLDSDGTFLHSQDTAELEDGADSYILEVFMAFLQKWALPAK
jgi:thiol:disulfide interchange protein